MPIKSRHILAIAALVLAGCALSGCGTIDEKLAAGVSDAVPAWAGGLPADAPPRPGSAKYDEFMKERERKRLLPASERGEEAEASDGCTHPVFELALFIERDPCSHVSASHAKTELSTSKRRWHRIDHVAISRTVVRGDRFNN